MGMQYLGGPAEKSSKKPEPPQQKKPQKESLLEPNRSQNVAIAKRKLTLSVDDLKQAVTMYVYIVCMCGCISKMFFLYMTFVRKILMSSV